MQRKVDWCLDSCVHDDLAALSQTTAQGRLHLWKIKQSEITSEKLVAGLEWANKIDDSRVAGSPHLNAGRNPVQLVAQK